MNKTIITIAVITTVGAGSFYSGTKYSQSKSFAAAGDASEQGRFGQAGFQSGGGMGGGRRGGITNNGGGFSGGEIIAKDDKSITVKLRDNGSKIIFVSDSTQVMKAVSGSLKDLSIGQNVTAIGSSNPDGSITAQSIQIRPASAQLQQSDPALTMELSK